MRGVDRRVGTPEAGLDDVVRPTVEGRQAGHAVLQGLRYYIVFGRYTCANRVGGSNGNRGWRVGGMDTILELIDPCPYNIQISVYGYCSSL